MSETEGMVLLDTSVVIAPPAGGLDVSLGGGAVSVITIAELQFGVGTTTDPIEQQLRRSRVRRIATVFDVIGLDAATTEMYGALAGAVKAAGRSPRPRRFDLLIAATAARHGMKLATRNPDDFRHLERALTVIPVTD